MRICISSLALGIGLLTETAFALGQAPSPTVVAQAAASERPSGVLITPPLAPVAVPPSGVSADSRASRRRRGTVQVVPKDTDC